MPNVRQRDFNLPDPDPIAYLPFRTDPRGFMTLLVRSQGDPKAMTPILREEVRAADHLGLRLEFLDEQAADGLPLGFRIGLAFQRKLGAGLFGGEGFILQKLEGQGLVFVHSGGTVFEKQLAAGETLRVDTGCLVAFETQVNYDIQMVPGIKTAIFGGEGLFFAALTGPGHIWLQTLPFSRLAGRVLSSLPRGVSGRKGEGSILGGLGNLLDGS